MPQATMSNHELARRAAAEVPTDLLIEGAWRPALRGARFVVRDPATGAPIAEVADGRADDAAAALAAAASAGARWAGTPARERAEVLRRAATGLRERAQPLAALASFEMGKPLPESRAEMAYAADFLDWYAGEALRMPGGLSRSPDGTTTIAITRDPVGICVFVTPWNFPAAMPARKLAPALAAGCTVVLKPADLAPLSANALVSLLLEAGLPDGVVNVVHTSDPAAVVAPLLRDRRTRKLSFTGSTAVGRRLMAQSADRVLRVSLELGGNAPFIVCADADVDAAVDGAVLAKMRNNGQACTAANRFYVEAPVVEAFTEQLMQRLTAMRIGHGLDDGVEVGPLINEAGLAKAERVIALARGDGAQVLRGVEAPSELGGSFCRATVLTGVPAHSAALHEEVFAPVAPIVNVADDREALALANATPFGLVAYLYTRDLDRARALAGGLESGMVGVNVGVVSNVAAPFGGVKESGLGREGSAAGLEEFLETKYVAIG
jgi:succinate-semialdehyde dehydrogenase/glutarate-semialdehyde dehydrogenase